MSSSSAPPKGGPSFDAQDSVTPSEDWPTDEEADYDNYYGEDDRDVDLNGSGEEETHDASFQRDPEYYQYVCLSTEETWNYLNTQVRDMSKDIKLDIPSSRILLNYLNWNTKELIKRFSTERDELLVSAQLRPKRQDVTPVSLLGECPVCLRLANGTCHMYGLPCGHMFCVDCWIQYIISKIAVGVSTAIECLQCHTLVELETVQFLLETHCEDSVRFLHFALGDYVFSHSLLRWCPGPNCDTVFRVDVPQPKKVMCFKCSTSCCFSCGEAYHCPTDCDSIKIWLTKSVDESETANYIMANTKDCPTCHTSIEKNGGCNHMACSQCHSDFCWMCLGPWKTHNGYYNCSKYKGDTQKTNDARQALEKYLFYYQRWDNHNQSLNLEEVTKKKIMDRIEDKVHKGEGTWIDWQYLLDAVALLRKCRYSLKYTYPCAYFLTGDRKPLFEYQQAQLEVEIENLSWKVERAESTDVAELRQQMNRAEVNRLTLLRDFIAS